MQSAQVTAKEALQRLQDGNLRYVSNKPLRPNQTAQHREGVAQVQTPFAVLVGCSDSRVPAEIVFDQGIGDLFVIRTAGHRVDDIAVASVEFAVKELGVRLVVVLGHQDCGLVKAAMAMPTVGPVQAWNVDSPVASDHIPRLLNKLQDVIERSRGLPGDPVENAVKENVRTVMRKLLDSSSILQEASFIGGMQIAGAYYKLDTGVITFLEN